MSPQSIASKSSPDSISIMLRPISPRPPRGISRTTGSTKLLSESGLIVPSTSKFAVVSRSVEAGRREESTPRNIEAPRPALRVNAQDSDARLTEMECWRACVSRRAGLSHADHGKRTGRTVAALMNDQREPTESIWGGGLEARDELSRLVVEVGAGGGRDRLTGNELLAERVHEGAVVRDAIVEMWARRQPRGTHVADDLLLPNARAGSDVGRDPREMVVLRLVARPMADVHLDPVAAVPPGVHDDAVGDRADRSADRRPVVDREMGAHAAEDRMWSRVGEARRDARELERRLEEALPERRARLVAHRHRLVPSVPGDLDRGARPDPSKIGAVLPELRGERSGGARRQPTSRERLGERIAAPHLDASDRERIGGNDEGFHLRIGKPVGRRSRSRPDI